MFYRIKKTRKYQAPAAKVTHMEFEGNFCVDSVRFNVQVKDLENINVKEGTTDAEGPMYFEF